MPERRNKKYRVRKFIKCDEKALDFLQSWSYNARVTSTNLALSQEKSNVISFRLFLSSPKQNTYFVMQHVRGSSSTVL